MNARNLLAPGSLLPMLTSKSTWRRRQHLDRAFATVRTRTASACSSTLLDCTATSGPVPLGLGVDRLWVAQWNGDRPDYTDRLAVHQTPTRLGPRLRRPGRPRRTVDGVDLSRADRGVSAPTTEAARLVAPSDGW